MNPELTTVNKIKMEEMTSGNIDRLSYKIFKTIFIAFKGKEGI